MHMVCELSNPGARRMTMKRCNSVRARFTFFFRADIDRINLFSDNVPFYNSHYILHEDKI